MAKEKDLLIKRLQDGQGPAIEALQSLLELTRDHARRYRRALAEAGIAIPRVSPSPTQPSPDRPVTTVGVEGPPEPPVPSPSKAIKRAEPPTLSSAGHPKRSRPSG